MFPSLIRPNVRTSRLAGTGLVLASLVTVIAPATAQNRSIINGGFEQPAHASGVAFPTEDEVPGWQTTASDNLMELWRSGFSGVPSFEGDQFAELNANEVSTLFQPLCLVPGDTVNWSFAHRGRSGDDTIRLTIGTDVITTETSGNDNWSTYSGTYSPTLTASAPVDFFFESVSAAGGGAAGNFLDAVEIVLPPHYELSVSTSSGVEAAGDNLPVLLVTGTVTTEGSVDVAVAGTATSGDDYTFTSTLTIPVGEYDGTVATAIPLGIAITDDAAAESDETLEITISNPTGDNDGNAARIADVDCNDSAIDSATYTISDDDGAAVCGDGVAEGSEGCDDGNNDDGDGCSAACAVEDFYECVRADFDLLDDEFIGSVAPNWTLSQDGFTVVQSVNSDPSVYVSTLPATDIGEIELTLEVNNSNDDDFIGVVLGLDEDELTVDTASYLLIDWKARDQADLNGVPTTAGLAVSEVSGATNAQDLGAHQNSVTELARATNLGSTGWAVGTTYTWKLTYTDTSLTLIVDDVVEIDIDAADVGLTSFPRGNIGFYNYSQENVTYSLLSPRGISVCTLTDEDDDGVPDRDDACPGSDDNLDADSDGVPDACDACPDDAGGAVDSDGDGVCDNADLCADADDNVDADADGVPDACDACPDDAGNDDDADGVCAAVDNCPGSANADQFDFDNDGVGDACDDDSYGLQGGGCSAGAGPAGGLSALLILLALALWRRRRRTPGTVG
ncbi:MYXO-CTERM sorting domain-containing protein [Haliangium sp.]|uniref:MYXO-CTERM sorting domain-containing protein n=1 Tax=Haliangium sp. TaxID=2663208 RepID=UPI003D117E8D